MDQNSGEVPAVRDAKTRPWQAGDTALDIRRGLVGEIQQIDRYISGRAAWMRPPNGGKEWAAGLTDLRPVDADVNAA